MTGSWARAASESGLEELPSKSQMPEIIVIMGPQGAGKGTQAQKLAEQFGFPIIATGEILRQVAKQDTELGRQVQETQHKGQLVSDEVLAAIIEERLCVGDCDRGCLLDGFPRTLPQAEFLDQLSTRKDMRVRAFNINVPRDMLWKRLAGRRQCLKCGTIYNIYYKPSEREGVCDLDGSKLITREDDNSEAIEKRLALYDEKTRPLLDYYNQSGRLTEVDGTGRPDEVYERLVAAMNLETVQGSQHG